MPSGLPSASEIASTLRGIRLPATKDQIVQHAEDNDVKGKVLFMLQQLPERDYNAASDVAKGLSEVATDLKERGSSGISASEVARTIKGIDFPASKKAIIEQAKKNGADDRVLQVFNAMDEGEFHNVMDIGRGIREAKTSLRERVFEEWTREKPAEVKKRPKQRA